MFAAGTVATVESGTDILAALRASLAADIEMDVTDDAQRALALLAGTELGVRPGQPALDAIRQIEGLGRRLRAIQIQLQAEIEEADAARADAFSSAKALVRYGAKLSKRAAAQRDRGLRMARNLPEVFSALADGELGVDHFDLLALIHANPRVRPAMVDAQSWFLAQAAELSFDDFDNVVRAWERIADADGPEPKNSQNHERRNASLLQDAVDLGWDLRGNFAALQGAGMAEIYERYIEAERLADWADAREIHGNEATEAQLARTEPQRRADSLEKVFNDAASADGSAAGVDFVHTIVWDSATYEEMLRRLAGDVPRALDPTTTRCETLDGVPLEPIEAAANSLVHRFRRAVVDAAGVVIDLGRARRFTGSARIAAQLTASHCCWPGCTVPSSRCEIDHSVEHVRGGRTNPGNGAPFCGKHNRWKQKGFAVWRDPVGGWHTYRPDGSEIL